MIVDPKDISIGQFHRYMLASVAPRPIAFVSTIDKEGKVNLSPYSNFNFFGANPPTMIFSPSRRVRDNTTKHTLENVLEVPEVVINIVDFPLVEQMSLSSTEYEKGVNEFIKSGLTEISSEKVKPPRVKESPVSFECKVSQVISLGEGPGSGNLVVCEVLLMHVDEEVLDEHQMVDPVKLNPVARLGGNWYSRVNPDVLFEVEKPLVDRGIGFDNLPDQVFQLGLSKNHLARLANVKSLPANISDSDSDVIDSVKLNVQELLDSGKVIDAWGVLNKWMKGSDG